MAARGRRLVSLAHGISSVGWVRAGMLGAVLRKRSDSPAGSMRCPALPLVGQQARPTRACAHRSKRLSTLHKFAGVGIREAIGQSLTALLADRSSGRAARAPALRRRARRRRLDWRPNLASWARRAAGDCHFVRTWSLWPRRRRRLPRVYPMADLGGNPLPLATARAAVGSVRNGRSRRTPLRAATARSERKHTIARGSALRVWP